VTDTRLLFRIRFWLGVEVAGLVLAGVTAFPLVHESHLLVQHVHIAFLDRVAHGLDETSRSYPFLAYGTDWLAFAHLTIAVAFWGPMREPVRNIWVVQFGMIACAGIIPLALIAGPVRHIPFWWTCIDMSFRVFGIVPLLLAYRHIRKLAGHERSRAIKAGVAATA
jgi:hypothetical protein